MNYAILVPYLGGNHKYALNTYVITAKNSAGDTSWLGVPEAVAE